MPDYTLVVGNPARQVGWMCECGVKLEFRRKKARCQGCNKEYLKEGLKVVKLKRGEHYNANSFSRFEGTI